MKTANASHFFSDKERDLIRAAVAEAERNTSGEIATMVVYRSDSYREAEILGGVLLAGLAALIAALFLDYAIISRGLSEWAGRNGQSVEFFLHGVSLWTYIPLVFLFFFPARYLFKRFPSLKLPLVGKKRVAEAVRERAVRAFFEKKLYKTRDQSGVLVFMSILERKVWILGDRGIDAKIPHAAWQKLAGDLSRGFRENRACPALCSVIAQIGSELAAHFPRRTDDSNELGDELIS